MPQTLKLKLVLRPVLWQFQQFLDICLCFADNLVRGLCRPLCASHLQRPLQDRSEMSRYFKATAASSNLCVQILYDFQALHLYCNCISKKILLRLSAVVLRLYGISLSLSVYFLFRFWTFIPSLVPTNILREWRTFDNGLVVLLQLPHIDLTELLLQFSKPSLLLRIGAWIRPIMSHHNANVVHTSDGFLVRSTSVCPRNLKTCTCNIGTLQT